MYAWHCITPTAIWAKAFLNVEHCEQTVKGLKHSFKNKTWEHYNHIHKKNTWHSPGIFGTKKEIFSYAPNTAVELTKNGHLQQQVTCSKVTMAEVHAYSSAISTSKNPLQTLWNATTSTILAEQTTHVPELQALKVILCNKVTTSHINPTCMNTACKLIQCQCWTSNTFVPLCATWDTNSHQRRFSVELRESP